MTTHARGRGGRAWGPMREQARLILIGPNGYVNYPV